MNERFLIPGSFPESFPEPQATNQGDAAIFFGAARFYRPVASAMKYR